MRGFVLKAIMKKDWIEAGQNKGFSIPTVVVSVVFSLFIPVLVLLLFRLAPSAAMNGLNPEELAGFMANFPSAVTESLSGLGEIETMLVVVLGYLYAPMFLTIPLMVSTIIASDSFAGERERKTIESLLYTPATDQELLLGKALAAFVPAILLTWFCFLIYSLVLNTLGFSIYGRVWFPTLNWIPLIFWVTPAVSAIGTMFTVLVSSKNPTFMGSYQTSGVLVLVVLGLVAGQAVGLLYLGMGVSLLLGLIFWMIAAFLTYLAGRVFNRKALLQSQ